MKPGKLAHAVIEELRKGGVKEVCVAAGARNAELLIAISEAEFRTYRFVDERAAGFFALGRIMASEKPVAVVTTSGTAVAELLPAVVEAHYQGLSLGVVSADRPMRYSGSGAPQVIEQPGIFGKYVASEGDVAGADAVMDFGCFLPSNAPWHLNVRLEEPGIEAGECGGSYGGAVGDAMMVPIDASGEGRMVVLIGDLMPSEREEVAELVAKLGCEVWAEAQSGLRERCTTLRGGERALKNGEFTRVLRIGGVPSCRYWRDLEEMPEVSVISVSRSGYGGLARDVSVVRKMSDLPELITSSPKHRSPISDSKSEPAPGTEGRFVHWLSTLPGEGAAIFLGNSLPIREWNAFASWEDRGLRPFANRGANGIDGLLSTYLGISAHEPESWAILGDLSTLYDLGAPWITSQLDSGKRRIVIINNGGGQIFNTLPALNDAPVAAREMMLNPHENQFQAFAQMWGWEYLRLTEPKLEGDLPDHVVIEVVL